MMRREIYRSKSGRVALIARGKVYSVEIAGAEYGPFSWSDALT